MKVSIYTLSDETGIRYIGKSSETERRFRVHLLESKKENTHKEKWIASLLRNGKSPIMEILEVVDESEWQDAEQYWISQFKAWGFVLVNGTCGGDGSNGFKGRTHSVETKAKISLSASNVTRTKGLNSPIASLTREQVLLLREESRNGLGARKLSKKYNITRSVVNRCINYTTYKDVE